MKRPKLWLASILQTLASSLSGGTLAKEHRKKDYPEARHVAPITRAVVQIPDSVLQEYRTTQNQQEADNRKTRHISLAAVGIAAIVAGIGIWQAILTRTQLNLSERPWASLDLSTLSIVNQTLTFNPKGGFITIVGEMRNDGNSVAMHTQSDIMIMDASQLPRNAQMQTAQLCKVPRSPDQSVGFALFPGDRAPITEGAEFYPKDIAYALSHDRIKHRVVPIAVVCIQYQSVFEPKYHLTQYVFFLLNSQHIGAFEPKGAIPDLYLEHVFFGDLAY